MKIALLFLVCVSFVFAAHGPEMAKRINSMNGVRWTAGPSKFDTWSTEEIKSMLGTKPYTHRTEPYTPRYTGSIPDTFDVRQNWKGCAARILDQGKCGSCWAFGSTEALSDRFCTQANMTSLQLSPQDPVSCDGYDMGCNGGQPDNVWTYLQRTGAVDLDCLPYTSGAAGDVPECPSKCKNGGEWKKYKAKSFKHCSSLFFWEDMEIIQKAIIEGGSVSAAFTVYEDFMSYKSGVYHHKSGQELGGHMVKIVGWGVDSGTEYWLVANSWGTSWGEQGYFKIQRGTSHDECGIQAQVYAGVAAV